LDSKTRNKERKKKLWEKEGGGTGEKICNRETKIFEKSSKIRRGLAKGAFLGEKVLRRRKGDRKGGEAPWGSRVCSKEKAYFGKPRRMKSRGGKGRGKGGKKVFPKRKLKENVEEGSLAEGRERCSRGVRGEG